jgi:hypothetical protein
MPLRSLLAGLLFINTSLVGCGGEEGNAIATADCGLLQIGWPRLTFPPPLQVPVWRLRLDAGSRVYVNGTRMEVDRALGALERANNLRPAGFVIIEVRKTDNCPDILRLGRAVDSRFRCSTNACFYTMAP